MQTTVPPAAAAARKHGPVFYLAVALTAGLALWGFAEPELLAAQSARALAFTTRNFGWFFLLATFSFLVFCVYLIFSPFHRIKLGRDDERPEYSFSSWLAMLFSAGMGIGLVFYAVAEPMYHFVDPPMAQAAARTPEAARLALRYSFFHWCLHPWAIYTLIALAIAYTQFRRGDSGLISATFRPLFGRSVDGPLGKGIDVFATLATVFGVATSLGLGTLQINGGLTYLFGVPNSIWVQLLIILVVTVLFMLSAITGLNRGILYLSNLNMILAVGLLAFVFIAGPTRFILEALTTVVGGYLQNLMAMSFRLTPFTQNEWVGHWTLFYWAWWIAWAPFVGSFIARVSRGRTIREFVTGVLIVPSVIGAIWFATFGGAALSLDLLQNQDIAGAVQKDMTSALFACLSHFPMGAVLGGLAALLIVTFFVTSADSATFVLGIFTSKGNPNPATTTKLIWGALLACIAGALLYSGGLKGLQTASIVAALPFAIIMVLMMVSLVRALRQEVRQPTQPPPSKPAPPANQPDAMELVE